MQPPSHRLRHASDRTWKALTGLSQREFLVLVPMFVHAWQVFLATKPNRKRKPGAGIKGVLPTPEEKLFFALVYLKAYPTFDVMGFMWGTDRTRAHKWSQKLLPILRGSLGMTGDLPRRKIRSVEEFLQRFPEAKDVFLDGTERRTNRPANPRSERKRYSGKKKAHTRKNLVVADDHRRILVLTPAKSGRRHDKRLADKSGIAYILPPEVTAWTDTGFQGFQKIHPNTAMPRKTSKDRPLTDGERQEHALIASIRIVAEHAIGGMKRLRAATDILRSTTAGLGDLFMELAAGLWNFHLAQG